LGGEHARLGLDPQQQRVERSVVRQHLLLSEEGDETAPDRVDGSGHRRGVARGGRRRRRPADDRRLPAWGQAAA
jgi:hypothetical protein